MFGISMRQGGAVPAMETVEGDWQVIPIQPAESAEPTD